MAALGHTGREADMLAVLPTMAPHVEIGECMGMASEPKTSAGDRSETDSPEDGLTRSFGWSDMFVRPEDDPRTDGGFGDERWTSTPPSTTPSR